jgi:hypothetical protein
MVQKITDWNEISEIIGYLNDSGSHNNKTSCGVVVAGCVELKDYWDLFVLV